MKHTVRLRSFLALAGSSLLAVSSANAQIRYWDGALTGGTGDGTSNGGAGTWDTSTLNWDQGNALARVAWNSSAPNYAVIAGTGSTITVGSGVTTSGIDFLGNAYVLDATSNGLAFGSGSNQLRIAGNNWAATINGAISGSGDMHIESIFANGQPVTGNSQPVFNFGGTSTGGWEGQTTIRRPTTLHMSSDTNQVLNSTSAINLQGGTIQITSTVANSVTNNRINDDADITIDGGGSIRITNSNLAGNVYSESVGDVTLNSGYASFLFTTNLNTTGTTQTLTLNSFTRNNHSVVSFGPSANSAGVIQITGATETPSGQILGPWALHGNGNTNNDFARINSSGQVVALAAANNNTETSWSTSWSATANTATQLAAGSLSANRTFNTLRFNNASTLGLGDFALAAYGILNGAGNYTINAGANGFITIPSDNGDGALYLSQGNGNLTVNAPIKDNGSNKLTLVLGGNHGLISLNGNSDYTGGTVISRSSVRNSATNGAGNVNIGHANALGANTNYLQFDSGSLNLNGFGVTVGAFTGGPSAQVTNSTGTGILTVGNGTASNSVSNFEGSISSGLFVKNGNGTQILSGSNNAAAATAQYTVNSGTLQFAKVDSFYAGSVYGAPTTANWTKARTIVNNGATLAFNVGGDREFTAAQLNTIMTNLGGTNALGTEGFQAGSRLGLDTTNAAGGSFTQGNAIADSSGAGGGAIGLIKLGTGTLVLDKANTYTGSTTVSAGTLELADNGSLRFAIGATGVNNGIGGTGTLTLNGDFVFDLTAAGTTAGNSWNIVNVASLTETFGGTFQVLSTLGSFTEASGIWSKVENGVTYNFTQSTGVLSVIPEPSTALAGILLGLGLLRRRRTA